MATTVLRLASAIFLIFAVAACGGGNSSGTTGSAAESPDSTQATGSTGAGSTAPETPATTTPETDTTSASEGSGDMADPCSALTTEEIVTITGVEFGDGAINDLVTNEFQVACDWTSAGDGVGVVQVLIIADSADFITDARAAAEDIFEVTDLSIPGASDAYNAEGMVGMAIGPHFVQVAYIPVGLEDVSAEAAELATIAASRLGG